MNVLAKLGAGLSLTRDEAGSLASAMLHREMTPAQCGAALAAMRVRGESADEICGVVCAMRELSRPVPIEIDGLVDTCGTGGDGHCTLNVSTVSAVVAAAAGVRIAKHCNRAVTGRCGSSDLLKALKIRFDGPSEFVVRSLEATGLAFLFAPLFHPVLREMADIRRELGFRTIFNIAGPLSNPARAQRQVIGVFRLSLTRIVAEALRDLGAVHCLVVHGSDGMDEITTGGPTHVCELRDGTITEYDIVPESFGVTPSVAADLRVDDAEASAAMTMDVLRGRRFAGRDAVVLNAGAAIYVGGLANSLAEGATQVVRVIDSGAAMAKLQELQRHSAES